MNITLPVAVFRSSLPFAVALLVATGAAAHAKSRSSSAQGHRTRIPRWPHAPPIRERQPSVPSGDRFRPREMNARS